MLRRFYSFFPKNNVFLGTFLRFGFSLCCFLLKNSYFFYLLRSVLMRPYGLSSSMGVGSGGQDGLGPPWIFIHGTNIVNRSLKMLFFSLFFHCPPGNFSPDVLESKKYAPTYPTLLCLF